MKVKNIKYYISFLLFFVVCTSCKAMELTYFDKDVVDVFNDATLILLSFLGRLILLFLIIGGVLYVISGSNPDNQEKAKKLIAFTLVGSIFTLLSYGILDTISHISTDIEINIISATVVPASGIPPTTFTIKTTITSVVGVDATTTKASIQSPNEVEVANILLKDDGIAPDLVAGDDIYSGDWTSGAVGPYFVDITACNNDGFCKEIEDI